MTIRDTFREGRSDLLVCYEIAPYDYVIREQNNPNAGTIELLCIHT